MTSLDRCDACGGLVDQDDLFCPNCGKEVQNGHRSETMTLATGAKNFGCKNCGASMVYDAQSLALKCPFCGSVDLEEQGTKGILAPDLVIPFRISTSEAESRLRAWLGSSFWYPKDLRTAAQHTEIKGVYVPFWIFAARVETHWAGDSNRVPLGASASWYPLSGYRENSYDELWIPASEGLSTHELYAVSPFDTHEALPPDKADLALATVEQFSVSRKYARPLAQAQLENLETQAVTSEVGGGMRNVRVNVLMKDATSRAALVPIFVMAYRYRDRLFRFVLNGQTGKATGSAPKSITKIVVTLLIVLGLLGLGIGLLLR
jgi:RNA polymerase subunit RPABC4/transcription elongation factor Spt4